MIITNRKALEAELMLNVREEVITKALIDIDMIDSGTYIKENEKAIATAAIKILAGALATPNISEGTFSQSYDRAGIQDRLSYLCNYHGIKNHLGSKIIFANVW